MTIRFLRGTGGLQLLVELAAGARNVDSAGDIALAVFDPLHNPGRFAALRAIRALGGVHYFLAISRLGDLGHYFLLREILIGAVCFSNLHFNIG